MEVRPGYKQTEVGVIPACWKVTPLDESVRGDSPICYGILMPGAHCNSGVPVVKVRDISDGRIDESDLLLTHPSIDHAYKRSRLAPGDLLVTIRGTTGRVALVPASLAGANITQDTARVRLKDDIHAQFLYFAIQSEAVQKQIVLHTIGQAVRGINIRDVRGLEIAFPDRQSEQRAIAGALSDVDALLGGLDRLIAKKRDLKQSAMQQLLTGQTRLPGFHGEWAVKALAAVCSMKSGEGITSASIDQQSQYPCYGGNGLRGFTSRFTHRGRYALIGRQGALCGNVFGVEGDFFASEHAVVVSSSANTDIWWLTYVLGRMNLNQYSESSAQPGLSISKILNLTFSAPPTENEQAAIAAVLSDMDAELSALEARRDKTHALKQGMMQELLTGRTRLV